MIFKPPLCFPIYFCKSLRDEEEGSRMGISVFPVQLCVVFGWRISAETRVGSETSPKTEGRPLPGSQFTEAAPDFTIINPGIKDQVVPEEV